MRKIQRLLISFFTFIGGLYFFLEFVLPKSIGGMEFGAYHEHILKGIQVIGVMAIGLGIISILKVHSRNIVAQKSRWFNSLVLLTGFLLMLGFQASNFLDERRSNEIKKKLELEKSFLTVVDKERDTKPVKPRLEALDRELTALEVELSANYTGDEAQAAAFIAAHQSIKASTDIFTESERENISGKLGAVSEIVALKLETKLNNSFSKRSMDLFNNGLFVPLGSAIFALLAFYIANAAFRSFRVRSLESFLLMAAAVIVMLGQIPQGPMYISSDLPYIRLLLLKNISTPAFRAIFFGSAIAGLAMAIRIWFSLEKSPLDEGEGGIE